MNHSLKKAAKDYVCYECDGEIKKGDLYSKQGRGLSRSQSVGWNQNQTVSEKENICEQCTKEGKYTHAYVKQNPESFIGCVKFTGKYFGEKWCNVDKNTLVWYAQNLQSRGYYHEIEAECLRRGICIEKSISEE